MRAVTLVLAGLLALATASSEQKVVCYFGSWAVYRPGNGKFDISYIDPKLCTHMIYTFVGISTDGNVRVLDGWQDLAENYGKDGFGRFNKLRELSPDTKTMVAIGGWNEGSAKYSEVVGNPTIRKRFVENVVKFVKKYDFDGFDVDWEYPNQRGGKPEDKQNYILLLKELREAFDKHGLLLSAAVGAAEQSASQSYIISEMSKYLHFINLMTYDLHGIWDKKTGINAPLYAGSWEQGNEAKLNVEASVKYWLAQGAAPEKLIMGIPLYGRGFTLSDPSNKGIGSPANQPAIAGPYTREAGMLGYNEICEKIKNDNWQVEWQEEQRVPFAYKGNQWVGYDDQRSIKEKADFAKKYGLGGMMVWSVETDDFKGICGEKYPLLKAINHELRNGPAPKPTPPPSQVPQEPESPKQPEQPQQPQQPEQPQEPQQPQQPSADGICTKEGYTRDPNDCRVFYYCQPNGNSFTSSRFECPAGTAFDTTINGCNFTSAVQGC